MPYYGCGRDWPCGRPPAQIRTCGITAYGSLLTPLRRGGERGEHVAEFVGMASEPFEAVGCGPLAVADDALHVEAV